ncbi:hypothetical protein DSM112329_03834 [Paraconexibacter sp. AEG42_29]|uniref:Uncharacterized protein n=1 Tax=Paraconexibacter sp. AEG42_29 TaxID=2997339 RepID=A0AAU7AYX3_9ACTN
MKWITKSHAAASTAAAFTAIVAVAAAAGPGSAPVPSTPVRTAVVVSDARAVVPPAAEVRRVTGPLEAQGAVLALVAHGYSTVIGIGPEARAAIELARAGEAAPGVTLVGR